MTTKMKNVRYGHCLMVIFCAFWLISCEKSTPPVAKWQHAAVGLLDASVSRDGRFAVVSSVNHGAGYWDLEKNELLFEWKHNDNPEDGILSTDISPDGSRAITADKQTFIIWNTNHGKPYGYWQTPAEINDVAISDKGRHVLLGLSNGLVIYTDIETGRRIEFKGHGNEAILSVDISPNGLWAFSGGNDHRAILWNTQTGKPRYVFQHEARVTLVALEHSGSLAFSSGNRGNAVIWDLSSGAEKTRLALKPREYVISAAAFSSNGKLVATGAPGRVIRVWSTQNGAKLNEWKASTRNQWKPSGAIIWALAFHEDGQHLISESSAGFGEKWRLTAR